MSTEFHRETRYAVIKFKDLNPCQTAALQSLMAEADIPTRECVVVEHDWPEYESVWSMIESRMTKESGA